MCAQGLDKEHLVTYVSTSNNTKVKRIYCTEYIPSGEETTYPIPVLRFFSK